MKNYYDELEVSKTASKEVIEKVYKVLAKKYHPDTTKESDKQAAEEKFKIISEAYEVLSDDEKRKKYDLELERSNPYISYEDYINVVNERNTLNNKLNRFTSQINYNQQYHNTDTQYNNSNRQDIKHKKQIYYNTVTGQQVSSFTYYKYKIKQFLSNILFLLLIIIVVVLAINAFLPFNLFNIL